MQLAQYKALGQFDGMRGSRCRTFWLVTWSGYGQILVVLRDGAPRALIFEYVRQEA